MLALRYSPSKDVPLKRNHVNVDKEGEGVEYEENVGPSSKRSKKKAKGEACSGAVSAKGEALSILRRSLLNRLCLMLKKMNKNLKVMCIRLVEFRRISLTGFHICTSRSHYRSVSKQTTWCE
ncbi:hypothetical protein Tco_1352680 [Tanacetum coccineum]